MQWGYYQSNENSKINGNISCGFSAIGPVTMEYRQLYQFPTLALVLSLNPIETVAAC